MSLLHHYTFSEESNQLFDMTDNNFHLLKVDTQPSLEARWGTRSIRFFNSSVVNPQASYSPFYSESFSICLWIRYNNIGLGQEFISGSGSNVVITLETTIAGAINFGLGSGLSPDHMKFRLQTLPNIVSSNEWINIIAVWDKATKIARVYLNGDKVGYLENAFSPATVEDDWQLGQRYDNTKKLEANINDLKIFDHVLSDYEIRLYGKSSALEIRNDRTYLWEINETIDQLSPDGIFGPATDIVEEDLVTEKIQWGPLGFKTSIVKEGF